LGNDEEQYLYLSSGIAQATVEGVARAACGDTVVLDKLIQVDLHI
jgi:hypothetical protein